MDNLFNNKYRLSRNIFYFGLDQRPSARRDLVVDFRQSVPRHSVAICGLEPHGGISTNSTHEIDPTPLSQYKKTNFQELHLPSSIHVPLS